MQKRPLPKIKPLEHKMVIDVVAVKALPSYMFWLKFEYGVEGIIDFCKLLPFEGVFEPLRDPERFGQIHVHPEFRVVTWPDELDLDSEVLCWHVTGVKEWE